jgi:hypothetical protein
MFCNTTLAWEAFLYANNDEHLAKAGPEISEAWGEPKIWGPQYIQ